jgi:hypothetical protein
MDEKSRNTIFLAGAAIISVAVGGMLGDYGFGWALMGSCMLTIACYSWWKDTDKDIKSRNIVFLSGAAIVSIAVGGIVHDYGIGWALFGSLMLVGACHSMWRYG